MLLVSELVTNALLHARSEIDLVLRVLEKAVRCEVYDGSRATPTLRPVDSAAVTGRGLALVAHLASDWGTERTPDGKVVWFEVQVMRS